MDVQAMERLCWIRHSLSPDLRGLTNGPGCSLGRCDIASLKRYRRAACRQREGHGIQGLREYVDPMTSAGLFWFSVDHLLRHLSGRPKSRMLAIASKTVLVINLMELLRAPDQEPRNHSANDHWLHSWRVFRLFRQKVACVRGLHTRSTI